MAERHDVVVVGAGQAGLTVSWYLRLLGIDHVVLERGRVGESWRSARWDSFTLVTPAWMTRLPGVVQPPGTGEEFTTRDDLVAMLDSFAAPLPVRDGVEVRSVRRDGGRYRLVTSAGVLTTRSVVAASGAQRLRVIPHMAKQLREPGVQLHASQYRNADLLPPGAVLVVGSGQSGAQIAEDLARAGRQVFLATSRVGRVPRRYRGRDAHDWSQEMGLHDRSVEEVPAEELRAAHPLLTGARLGHTLALQQLARDGVVLLGRLVDADGTTLRFGDDLGEHLRFGDRAAAAFRSSVDDYITRNHLSVPPPDFDPAERRLPAVRPGPLALDVTGAGIVAIVWCVGFGPDMAWVDLPVLDPRHNVVSTRGVTALPGFFTLGAPWLTHRGSALLYGVASDASRVARHIAAFLQAAVRSQPDVADFHRDARSFAS
jgi:putative flavoprotein involved in K+ transport